MIPLNIEVIEIQSPDHVMTGHRVLDVDTDRVSNAILHLRLSVGVDVEVSTAAELSKWRPILK